MTSVRKGGEISAEPNGKSIAGSSVFKTSTLSAKGGTITLAGKRGGERVTIGSKRENAGRRRSEALS